MTKTLLVAALIGSVAVSARGNDWEINKGPASTKPRFPWAALMAGAVYEVEVNVPSKQTDQYLETYAKWFLPVDQAPKSGRKLISVLSTEIGDDYNLRFLYWYESPFKKDYYCKYTKAFFDYHRKNNTEGFQATYAQTRKDLGRPADMMYEDIEKKLAACADNQPVPEAAETVAKFDLMLRDAIAAERGSWSYGVNPCFVKKLRDGKGKDIDQVVLEMQMKDVCPRSLLEQAITLK
jgi:hypothetical protein